MCDDVPPSSDCEVHLRRRFPEPGTYCVNITLEDSRSMALTSTTVTINKSQDTPGRLLKDMYSPLPCMFTRHSFDFLKYVLIINPFCLTSSFVERWHIDVFCLSACFCPLSLWFSVPAVSKTSRAAAVVLSSTAVLVAVFAFIAYLVCKWVVITCIYSTYCGMGTWTYS